MSSSNWERYEKYKFNATEDDHLVCNILLGLQNLIRKSDPSPSPSPSPLTWATKRRRSALNSSSSPAPDHPINNKQRLHSPSSPLGYSPNEAHNLHHSKTKSKKKVPSSYHIIYIYSFMCFVSIVILLFFVIIAIWVRIILQLSCVPWF